VEPAWGLSTVNDLCWRGWPRQAPWVIIVSTVKTRLLLGGLACATLIATAQTTGEVRGSVVDARGGEALANVRIQLVGGAYRATTDAAGHFRIPAVASGDYALNVSTVGYHLIKRPFHLGSGEIKDFEVILSPDTFHQTDTVEVKAGPFDTVPQDSPSALVLGGNDAKNLASVLADDPLRAVQDLPGVTSNNDFDARFSLRGADYSRIGLYLDGVLLHEPFHTLEAQNVSGSGTAFNGDMVESMELQEGAFPVRYEDRTAAVLDVDTRDGSRTDTVVRVAASASNAGVMAEGPLGKKKRGSWLVAARKSYLQYILERTFPNTSLIFGMEDVQGRLAYDLTPKNNVTLYVLESFSGLDRSQSKSSLGINSLMEASYHYTLTNLGWRYTPTDKLLIVNHAAWMREKYDNSDPSALPLAAGFYGEWVWNTTATWMWSPRGPLDVGWSYRRLRDGGYADQYQGVATSIRLLDRFDGTGEREGAYAEQSWSAWSGRLRMSGGIRWDDDSVDRVPAESPQGSVNLALTQATHLALAWGQYVQYPELSVLTSVLGSRNLLPMRSNHAIASLERRLSERTRLRLEYYNRADRDLIFQPLYDPRVLSNGTIFSPPLSPSYTNSLRGYARGFEVFVQRSSANKFTGWASYAFGRTEMRDGVTLERFPADFDQKHTVNLYGGYRLRPSVNLSLRETYGSGFPIPGYIQEVGGTYYLTSVRNQFRLPAYSRADARINKAWARDKWKATLYGEVVNLTNRTNWVFENLNSFNSKTGQVSLQLDKMFPILPSAGVVFER